MLDELARIFDEGGRLANVAYALFRGDRKFVTTIALVFEHLTAVFRVNPDDDTLVVTLGSMIAESDETIADASVLLPWSKCVGRNVSWAWQFTNHQGYKDGVRLEFNADTVQGPIIELIAIGSGIQVFEAVRQSF
jgi:hypothetical protein